MNKIVTPSVETTKDFILIKIPRNLMMGPFSYKKISRIEQGLQESINEALAGNVVGPFKDGKTFLRALKTQMKP